MEKYELLPMQIKQRLPLDTFTFFEPSERDIFEFKHTHKLVYLSQLKNLTVDERMWRQIGFPSSVEAVKREVRICSGTIECAEKAIQHKTVCLNIAGGTHHAFADKGEGFCILNDIAIASNHLLINKLASKILIIDLDVHQGNGTASIFNGSKNVFTFSMHGQHNYPFRKETSHLDIPLADGIEDEEYLSLLSNNLFRILHTYKPDFAFYLSGVDVLKTDRFGKLNLSLNACVKRDEMVFSMLNERAIYCAVTMGGGYSKDIRHIVDAHYATFEKALEVYT